MSVKQNSKEVAKWITPAIELVAVAFVVGLITVGDDEELDVIDVEASDALQIAHV